MSEDHSSSPLGRSQQRVLLVDDQRPFRDRVAIEFLRAGVDVLQASGVYDALQFARDHEVDLLVIGGEQRYQSGWPCAGKLCGRPPWGGVILYFGRVSERDRLWARVSELAALVETKGEVKRLIEPVLRNLGMSSPVAGRAVA